MTKEEKIKRFNEKYFIRNDKKNFTMADYENFKAAFKKIGLRFSHYDFEAEEWTIEDTDIKKIYSHMFDKEGKEGVSLEDVVPLFKNSEVKLKCEHYCYTFGNLVCKVKITEGVKTYLLNGCELTEDMLACINQVAEAHNPADKPTEEKPSEESSDDQDSE